MMTKTREIVILIVVVAVLGALIWWGQKLNDVPSVPAPLTAEEEDEPYAGWQTFEIKEWGISFWYPNNFKIKQNIRGDYDIRQTDTPQPGFTANAHLNYQTEIDTYHFVDPFDRGEGLVFDRHKNNWEYRGYEKTKTQNEILAGYTVANNPFFVFSWGDAGGYVDVYVLPFVKADAVIEVWAGFENYPDYPKSPTVEAAEDQFLKTVKKIVSTIEVVR